jgi:Protein of unknown function (DUF1566)
MIRMRTVATPRGLLGALGLLMLVLILSTDAFAACPSVFNVNFSASQYAECFRDLLRGSDINAGTDLGSTGKTALNFTGSTGASGNTWLTVYDAVPATSTGDSTFGAETLCADVLIQPLSNRKGAGVVALMNEGAGKKGLGLFISDAGNADTLVLSTVDGDLAQNGKLTTLTSVSLQGGITEKAWYRVVMSVNPTGTPKVTGKVFRHTTATNPNSALGAQVGVTLTYSPGSLPAGVSSPGENGIMASGISAIVNSSVTNFTNDPVACGGTTTARYVDNGDGTVTDTTTGLMWEKKVTECCYIHQVSESFTWGNYFQDGSAFSRFLGLMNFCTSNEDGSLVTAGFAGHCDWRLPSIAELKNIVDMTVPGCGTGTPCIDPIFGPTSLSCYWSSSTVAGDENYAWCINGIGLVYDYPKFESFHVRGVRGGS